MTLIVGGPLFDPKENEYRKSVHNRAGGHYNVFSTQTPERGMAFLRVWFPDGKANEFNFVLFSTSGIHGDYGTIEELEASFAKYPDGQPKVDLDDDPPDDWAGDTITFLVVQPRIVGTTYGNALVTAADIPFLKELRASSWAVVQEIGKDTAP